MNRGGSIPYSSLYLSSKRVFKESLSKVCTLVGSKIGSFIVSGTSGSLYTYLIVYFIFLEKKALLNESRI
jgi:hypothetical protein